MRLSAPLFIATITRLNAASGEITLPFADTTTVKKELTYGVWAGDEKFVEGTETFPFCSRVIFRPEENDKLFSWISAEGTCKELGVNQVGGRIWGDWFGSISVDLLFIERIISTECILGDGCPDDIISNPDEGDVSFNNDYYVAAKSCGRMHKIDLTTVGQPFFCDAWQVSLLKRKKHLYRPTKKLYPRGYEEEEKYHKKGADEIVILTLTYGSGFDDKSNPSCPMTPSFRVQDIMNDPEAAGAAQFVLQGNITLGSDPCTWDCFEDPEGICG